MSPIELSWTAKNIVKELRWRDWTNYIQKKTSPFFSHTCFTTFYIHSFHVYRKTKNTFSKLVGGGCKESSRIFTASPLRPIRWLIITSSAAGKKDKVSNSNDHIFNSFEGSRKEIDEEIQTCNDHIILHSHTGTHLLKSIFELCN